MILILTLIDWILFVPLALCVAYLLVYAIASKFYRAPHYPEADKLHRIAVFFPAYREDKVIIDSVRSFLEQDYPKEMYDVYVISDHMQDSTNKALSRLPIRLLVATYEDSSKAKALLLAISTIEEDGKAKGLGNRQLAFMYDIAVVMDADNVTVPGFLSEVNRAYSAGVQAMQAHRTGKNLNTDIALLDGVSEEINNGFSGADTTPSDCLPDWQARAWLLITSGITMPCKAWKPQERTKSWNLRCLSAECTPSIWNTYLSTTRKRKKREHQESAPALDGGAIRHLVRGTVLHKKRQADGRMVAVVALFRSGR